MRELPGRVRGPAEAGQSDRREVGLAAPDAEGGEEARRRVRGFGARMPKRLRIQGQRYRQNPQDDWE